MNVHLNVIDVHLTNNTFNPRIKTKYSAPLFTDLYQLTMMLAYRGNHMAANANFSLFIRSSEWFHRGFFVAAGLEDALSGLEGMRFSQADMDCLPDTLRIPWAPATK